MKKLAYLFQKGNIKKKIALVILVPLVLTIFMYLLYSLIFVTITILGGASFLVSTILGLLILLVSVMLYPVKKELDDYSDYSRKFLG